MFPTNPYTMLICAEQRAREFEAQALHARLVREALAGRKRQPRCYDCLFRWLGRQLIVLGARLQYRFSSATSPAPATRPGTEESVA
jgi:hypothetical protein